VYEWDEKCNVQEGKDAMWKGSVEKVAVIRWGIIFKYVRVSNVKLIEADASGVNV